MLKRPLALLFTALLVVGCDSPPITVSLTSVGNGHAIFLVENGSDRDVRAVTFTVTFTAAS